MVFCNEVKGSGQFIKVQHSVTLPVLEYTDFSSVSGRKYN